MDYFEDDEIEISAPGNLACVRFVSPDRRQASFEYRSGQFGSVSATGSLDLKVGDVVFVRENSFELAQRELWVEETWVGVVRIRLSDVTVLDASGRLRLVPTTTDVDYAAGNTVEACEGTGVVRVLQEQPIKYLDLPELDDSVVDRFRPSGGQRKETFDDFGGLHDVVARAKELIEVPLAHHERLAKINARPIKGVLFTGPPGAGKTMLARIIANETDAEFYEISGPEIFSKWYGQSEEILRLIFEHARQQERSIIFFDEIDSVAGQRGADAHEASRRVVAQLLTLMDGFDADDNVVVIAATNRPEDIDVALRRPGRFDWEIDFHSPSLQDREEILRISATRHSVRGHLPHELVAAKTRDWTGADLAAIWTEAALLAVTDQRDDIVAEDYFGGYQRVTAQREVQARTRRSEPTP